METQSSNSAMLHMSIASEVMGVSGAIANMQMESNDQELGLLSDYIPKVSN
jgi:hypothetical protein